MSKKMPIFVIHKHHASKLHYDVRLEIEGSLKSWALYKLPFKAGDPFHAVQVPDHPFWYRHFEGVIPEGKYGAGPVIIWDKGYFENVTFDDKGKRIPLEECLEQGFIAIWFNGTKIKGGYFLLRISKKQKWLLIKRHDKYARPTNRMLQGWGRSIKSNKTLEEIRRSKK